MVACAAIASKAFDAGLVSGDDVGDLVFDREFQVVALLRRKRLLPRLDRHALHTLDDAVRLVQERHHDRDGDVYNAASPSPWNRMTPTSAAPAWRRFTAIVYDALAVVAIVMVVGLLAQMATGGKLVGDHGQPLTWWYQPLQGVVVGAYFLVSWVRGGQTLGMRPWRIRVTDTDGAPATWRRGLVRLLVAALPLLLVLLYPMVSLKAALCAPLFGWLVLLLPAVVDRRRRAVYDMVAGTELRRLPT
jgi:uncharacterized RDD family membrane protein YckC